MNYISITALALLVSSSIEAASKEQEGPITKIPGDIHAVLAEKLDRQSLSFVSMTSKSMQQAYSAPLQEEKNADDIVKKVEASPGFNYEGKNTKYINIENIGDSSKSIDIALHILFDKYKIRALLLYGNNITIDLTPLIKSIDTLDTFSLSGISATDFSPINQFVNLASLSMVNTNFKDMELLKPLTKLKYLWLSGPNINNLTALENMKELKEFDLSRANNISEQQILSLKKVLPNLSIRFSRTY